MGDRMSFAYFPFYTGDYYRDTRHLSMLQHGAYRQLLDHCWDQKGPLPLDLEKCYRICGAVSKEEQECVRGVVAEFFVTMDDGHYQKRVMEEVARAEMWSQKSRQGGLKSAIARRTKARKGAADKRNEPPLNHRSTTVEPPLVSPSPSPSPSLKENTDTARKRAQPAAVVSVSDLVEAGCQEDHARDWLKTRGKPLTATAWKAVVREAGLARLSVGKAVELAAENQWRGFKAEWVKVGSSPNGAAQETSEYLSALSAHKAERPPAEVMAKIRGVVK